LILAVLIVTLPLMMGNRTPLTLTATALWLSVGAGLAWWLSFWQGQAHARVPTPNGFWWLVLITLSLQTLLQVLPIEMLARVFGPYPQALWDHPDYDPRTWSPNPGAAVRGWAVFVALFLVAWLASQMPPVLRGFLWLVIAASALFQALYGLISHATVATHVLGIWERHSVEWVQGTYSNRNLFAGYLALTWPLVVAVWWIRDVPLLRKLPNELRIAGSVISAAILGAALMGSASRLGAVSGLVGGLIAIALWTRHRGHLDGARVWPIWLAALAAFLFATWYGLAPLTDRLAMRSSVDALRPEVWSLMLSEIELKHWLAGVGLGGFEAVFKTIQTSDINGWWDYAHNDLLQWLLETGLIGALVLGLVLAGLIRNASLRMERIPLYAGLIALSMVGLGDFSWHMPGTQVVAAIYLGVLLRPAPRRREQVEAPERRRVRRRRRLRPRTI
jgi:hypothetical protein